MLPNVSAAGVPWSGEMSDTPQISLLRAIGLNGGGSYLQIHQRLWRQGIMPDYVVNDIVGLVLQAHTEGLVEPVPEGESGRVSSWRLTQAGCEKLL